MRSSHAPNTGPGHNGVTRTEHKTSNKKKHTYIRTHIRNTPKKRSCGSKKPRANHPRTHPFVLQASVAIIPAEVVVVPRPKNGSRTQRAIRARRRGYAKPPGRGAHVVQELVVLGVSEHRLKPARIWNQPINQSINQSNNQSMKRHRRQSVKN